MRSSLLAICWLLFELTDYYFSSFLSDLIYLTEKSEF